MNRGSRVKCNSADWAAMIDSYVIYLAGLGRPKTTRRLRKYQLQYLAKSLNLTPNVITEDDLLGWFGSHDWKPETRRSYRSGIRGFFAWATKNGLVTEDPSLEIPQVQRGAPIPRPAPDHVWRQAIIGADPRSSLMVRLAGEVGMRRSEVARVSVQDLRYSGAGRPQLLVHGKGSRQRLLPISDELAALIERGAAGHTLGASSKGYVFPGEWGGHLSPAWVGTIVSRLMPEIWTMHTLRHRFATKAYEGSGDIRAVQKMLGHSSLDVTIRYVESSDDAMRAAMNAAA